MTDSKEQMDMAQAQIQEWAEALAKTYNISAEALLQRTEKVSGKFENFQLHYSYTERLDRYYWRLQDHGSAMGKEQQKRGQLTKAAKMLENGYKICNRCGGAGKSEAWHRTGKTCYECGGKGVVREHVIQK